MPSTTVTQAMDGDCLYPVEATWEVEYDVTPGYPGDRDTPADGDEITVTMEDAALVSVCVYLEEDQGYGVTMLSQDGDRQTIVEARLRPRLDMELVKEACERHWDEVGKWDMENACNS